MIKRRTSQTELSTSWGRWYTGWVLAQAIQMQYRCNTYANPCMSGLCFQEESTGIEGTFGLNQSVHHLCMVWNWKRVFYTFSRVESIQVDFGSRSTRNNQVTLSGCSDVHVGRHFCCCYTAEIKDSKEGQKFERPGSNYDIPHSRKFTVVFTCFSERKFLQLLSNGTTGEASARFCVYFNPECLDSILTRVERGLFHFLCQV